MGSGVRKPLKLLGRHIGGGALAPLTFMKVVSEDTGVVLWEGDLSPVSQGPWTVNGTTVFTSAPNPYSSIQSLGNSASATATASLDSTVNRNARQSKSLKIVMQPGAQRCQFVSRDGATPPQQGRWTPDNLGTVDHFYGFSVLYGTDWGDLATLTSEISASMWHDPMALRTAGANGSMNISGDNNNDDGTGPITTPVSTPRTFYLRRNSVLDQSGFYVDGMGLDKLSLGEIFTNAWMDFVIRVRWDTTSGNAYRAVWRDGVFMGESATLNAVDTNRHDLRLGIYQTTAITHTRTAWYSNARIGTSYAAVDPASLT